MSVTGGVPAVAPTVPDQTLDLRPLLLAEFEPVLEPLADAGPGVRQVLVASASKYESTREIAQAIAAELTGRGLEVTETDVDEDSNLVMDSFDAFVLGSAVYAGQWLQPARWFVQRHEPVLAAKPVWLFSSGPLGPPATWEEPVDVAGIAEATKAREHRVFAGRLELERLTAADRAVAAALRAPEGDFRDWTAIRSWAGHIADALTGGGPQTMVQTDIVPN
ncbi:flavodoxin domain-containing protein [Catellatospora tritici]|uniref:flavodoxin domain-containing protein n=1 Tax=Catellatospora tritici TaxID=2851566 RepID=UPI001C2DA497|nr:flavodoxin domain-containing protein [Catellatospora tritici]MBV1849391.1 flavodoxin domain-containing protein [Catellatospora tritici]